MSKVAQRQVFRSTVLEWTPTLGVFVAWSGQELLKMRALLAQDKPEPPVVTLNTQAAVSTLNATISALQTTIPALQSVVKDLEPS